MLLNPMIIYHNLKILRHRSNATALATLLLLHKEKARTSPLAKRYSDATGYEPLALSETINSSKVIFHRLRIGYF